MNQSECTFQIYVISLARENQRVDEFKHRFHELMDKIMFVDAIDLRRGEDANALCMPAPCRRNHRKPLVATEKGCALSHMKAYATFLSNESLNWALILEDDILGSPRDLERIRDALAILPKDGFLLCGGQEGKNGARFLYGKKTRMNDLYELPPFVWNFMSGACCYAVSRSAARAVLDSQQRCLDRADNWIDLLPIKTPVYYLPVLAHPLLMETSHIDVARNRVIGTRNSLRRVWRDGVLRLLQNNGRKVMLRAFARIMGYEPVPPKA